MGSLVKSSVAVMVIWGLDQPTVPLAYGNSDHLARDMEVVKVLSEPRSKFGISLNTIIFLPFEEK